MTSVISTFSGIGGSSTGYKLAGCDVLAAVEFIPEAAKIYSANNPTTSVIQKDIRQITGKELLEAAGVKHIDILDGSPPCSAFSPLGKTNRKRTKFGMAADYRGVWQRVDNLWDEQIRLISEIKPTAIVIENVPAMGQKAHLPLLQNYLIQIKQLGYNIAARIMDASYYGCATARERLIVIGVKGNQKPSHPKPRKRLTLGMIKSKFPTNTKFDLYEANVWGQAPCTQNVFAHSSSAEHYAKKMKYGFSYSVCNELRPIPTLVAGGNIMMWEEKKRMFTIPEIMCIMGFTEPHEFKWLKDMSMGKKVEHLGRCVPPGMMKCIAEHVIRLIK